jgi:hypothetical protein
METNMNAYPLVQYGDLLFVRCCPVCHAFVKADAEIAVLRNSDGAARVVKPNAMCHRHGRVIMEFEGYWEEAQP